MVAFPREQAYIWAESERRTMETTIESVLPWAHELLRESHVPESLLNAELLLAHATGIDRLRLRIEGKREVTSGELSLFSSLIRRRARREPLQYIVGTTEFMGIILSVNPHVLIPRPETEVLVERALDLLRASVVDHPEVLDVGTGSGNIALSIRRFFPAARVTATDISDRAIETAMQNGRMNRIDGIDFQQVDLFSPLFPGKKFDLILSNPPYIPQAEFETLEPEVRLYEPMLATTDEGDGLRLIRALLRIGLEWLNPGGSMLLELGHGQAETVVREAEQHGLQDIRVYPDFAGIPRVFSASVLQTESRG